MVWLLFREEEYRPRPDNAGRAELIVAKQRNGPTGTILLRWSAETMRFSEPG